MFRRGTTSTSTTPTRYGRRGGSNSYNNRSRGTPRTGPPKEKGLFVDGIWHCNCTPRLPAEHFRVKKEGRNQGRWFYTCQNTEPRRCDFFLWDEDAKPRMEGAVLENSRSESGTAGTGNDGRAGGRVIGQGRRESQEPTLTPSPSTFKNSWENGNSGGSRVQNSGSVSAKRKFQETEFDDDDEEDTFPWALTGQEEEELARVADRVSHPPETPRKAVKTDAFATPSTISRRLPWLDYSGETPQPKSAPLNKAVSPPKSVVFGSLPTPTSARKSLGEAAGAMDVTPTPSRFKDALYGSGSPAAPSIPSVTDEVFALLATTSATLPLNITSQLRSILTKHDNMTQGVVKGRDAVRAALRTKDMKITDLQARIEGMEADREMDKSVIRKLKFDAQEKARKAKQTKLDFSTPRKNTVQQEKEDEDEEL